MRKFLILKAIYYLPLILIIIYTMAACTTMGPEDEIVAIGGTEREYVLVEELASVSGLAVKEGEKTNSLFVLDGVAKVIRNYSIVTDKLNLVYEDMIELGNEFSLPRGLEYSREGDNDILYFIDYSGKNHNLKSRLYRYNLSDKSSDFVDLSSDLYEIGDREVFGVTRQDDHLYISFNPSSFDDQILRMRRGIVKIFLGNSDNHSGDSPAGWQNATQGNPKIVRQMPGPGKPIKNGVMPCKSLTAMTMDGFPYLWGTIGEESIYLIEPGSGRGVFFFDIPSPILSENIFDGGLAFGAGHLWTAIKSDNAFVIHRLNVLDNLLVAYEGPKRFREMRLNIRSRPEEGVKNLRGEIYHAFCLPYGNEYTGHQGIIEGTLRVNDNSNIEGVEIKQSFFDPADDPVARQFYTMFIYNASQNPAVKEYESEVFIKFWTRDYKQFVYPHLVTIDQCSTCFPSVKYIEDDDTLYRFSDDPGIYPTFYDRVSDYTYKEYGVNIDKADPYWIARNTTEYIMENYHYPKDEFGFWATNDFEKGNYNANPGHFKADLSADDNYTDNIIACSGTAMLTVGAYRSIGQPSRWHGVTQERGWETWVDEGLGDSDEFLERGEESLAGNGHRYTEVWLGDLYGWKRFDATPKKPNGIEFDKKPLELSQWEFMFRCASGVEPRRVIHNMHSEFWKYLYVAFEKGEDINNSGSERYNFLGTYTYPEDFKPSSQRVRYSAIQFIDNISVDTSVMESVIIQWENNGEWDLDVDAKIQIVLEHASEKSKSNFEIVKVLDVVPFPANETNIDLSYYESGDYRIKIHKYGDPATGNALPFTIK